jgi:hypothetical protein
MNERGRPSPTAHRAILTSFTWPYAALSPRAYAATGITHKGHSRAGRVDARILCGDGHHHDDLSGGGQVVRRHQTRRRPRRRQAGTRPG